MTDFAGGRGPGTQQYYLTHVRTAPRDEQRTDVQASLGTTITEHSQVRLTMGEADELRRHLGQMVQLEGAVRDDGRNTIATTGPLETRSPSGQEPRTDQSQAAAKQHHSEKAREEMGPEVVVQRIEGTGQPCAPTPAERR